MQTFLADVIRIFHILFIIWFIVTPFTSNEPMLVLHLITAPLLMLHWILNDDTCCLWLAECKLRGIEKSESFFYQLITPFYRMDESVNDDNTARGVWYLTLGLWLVTLVKVCRDPGIIKRPFKVICDQNPRQIQVVRVGIIG